MSETSTRRPPQQARAAAKRVQILDAAERLLASLPPSELTTRSVAGEADVPIGSVYRYFANIEDLLGALFDRLNDETLASIEALGDDAAPWRVHLARVMAVVEDMHRRHPIYGALMRHLSARDEADEPIVEALGRRLAGASPALGADRARSVAATVVAIINGVERRYHALPPDRRGGVFMEGRRAVEAYLALYLD